MTIGADAIKSPLFAAMPQQGGLRRQDSLNDKPRDIALGQYPLKLVSSNAERPVVKARWKAVANSSSGRRTLGIAHHYHRGDGSVYECIKSIVLQRSWIPGELLQIGILARELGTSTTPVREALVRLAAERLIVYAPKKGFLVKTITEEELRGLYLLNLMCLQTALNYSCERAGNMHELAFGSRQSPVESDEGPASLVFITENLFLSIAVSAGIEEVVTMVGNINDRLHRPRIAEYAVIEGTLQEASAIADVYCANREYKKLDEALRNYHERRLRMLPVVCKELLSMAYSGR